MRLISNYPRQLVLPSPITIIATSTAAPALPKRANQPAICHGQGCLSVPSPSPPPPPPPPPAATTAPPPAARDNSGPATITEQVTIHVWTTIVSWRTAYDTVVGVTSLNTIATSVTTITQPITITEKLNITAPAPAPATITVTATPAPAPAPAQRHKGLQTGDIVACVLAAVIVILLAAMYVLTRRFYRMYRAERVLRKQVQTEGTELKPGSGGPDDRMGRGVGEKLEIS